MKKVLFFAAVALVALASCTSDEMVSPTSPPESTITNDPETPGAIVFSSASKGITRADLTGADAAALLGNKFVVSAKKGTTTASTTSNVTFDNYLVEYEENTAHKTESNTTNWEYVGKGRIKHAIDHGITSQTIKYWDYSAPQYDFIAWSTGLTTAIFEGTPSDGEVLVSAINPNATATAAYTFTGTAADLSKCYIADLVTVKKADYGDNPVTFKFRQLGTKVRIGIYETVPGYSVKNVEFYSAAASNDADETTPRLFTTTANDIFTSGKYTVTFPHVDNTSNPDNNQAHVSFDAEGVGQSTVVEWGSLNYTIAEEGEKSKDKVYLGRSSNTASFAGTADNNYYVVFLPNERGTNLNLRVNYTLEAIDGGGETIKVKGATAQVPSIYTTWKPGFAYTYLFKISDKTNGYTGVYDPTQPDNTTVNSDPAGLYPITFDAVVVNADETDKTQETITTVSTPSITTYQKGSTVVNDDEYNAATGDIYVTVNDGTAENTPDLANGALQDLTDKANLYTLSDGVPPYTEALVIDALQMQDDNASLGTVKGRSGLVLTKETLELTNTVEYGVDGNAIVIPEDGTKKKAAKFTPAAGTYAFVYTKTPATPANNKEIYQALNWANFESGQTKYRYGYKSPTHSYYNVNDNGTPTDDSDDTTTEYFDAQKGVKYFASAAGVYTMQDPFIGQGVGNLYLDALGNTIASGYAKSEVTYYYTTDNGMSYKAAHNVNYADFKNATDLYTFDGTSYILKTDQSPANGTAYYQKTTPGGVETYTYCVILPQQTNGWYELDTNTYVEADETSEVVGQTYFDKYIKNDGVYYAKIIKVQ